MYEENSHRGRRFKGDSGDNRYGNVLFLKNPLPPQYSPPDHREASTEPSLFESAHGGCVRRGAESPCSLPFLAYSGNGQSKRR